MGCLGPEQRPTSLYGFSLYLPAAQKSGCRCEVGARAGRRASGEWVLTTARMRGSRKAGRSWSGWANGASRRRASVGCVAGGGVVSGGRGPGGGAGTEWAGARPGRGWVSRAWRSTDVGRFSGSFRPSELGVSVGAGVRGVGEIYFQGVPFCLRYTGEFHLWLL